MSKIIRRGVITLAVLIFVLIPVWAISVAQEREQEYFPQTGHSITGEFYRKYMSAKSPLLVYGYPITDQMRSVDEKYVQYFQRARFELDEKGEISVTPLGKIYYPDRSTGFGVENDPSPTVPCRVFKETGFQVCYEFLNFFEQHGGVDQFGFPISNQEFSPDGGLIQFFENSIFEYRHGTLKGSNITVTELGYDYFDKLGENPRLQDPKRSNSILAEPVLDLDVDAFIHRDISGSKQEPILYVIVSDQKRSALEKASIEFRVKYPDGNDENFIMEPTNRYGFSSLAFPVRNSEPGRVEVQVYVTYADLQKETSTSFHIWY